MNHVKKCVIGISLFLGMTLTLSQESNQNLLSNPGFENDLESWEYRSDYGEFGMSEIFFDDPAAVHSGKKGAKLHVTEAGYIDTHVYLSVPPQWEAVKGQKYILTFWAKSQEPSKKLPLKSNSGYPDFTEMDKKTFSLSTDWKKYEFEFTSQADGTGAVHLTFCLGLDTGVFYFDDFILITVGEIINKNLLSNPSFENELESWHYEADYGEFGMSEIFFDDPTAVHSGKKGAKLHVTEAGYLDWHVKLSIPSKWEAVKNQKYLLTFWAKSQDPSKKLPLWGNSGFPDFAEIGRKNYTLSPEWKKFEYEFTSPADGAGAVQLTFCLGLDTGVFYFDDFVLKTVGEVISIRWFRIPSQKMTTLETNNNNYSYKIWDIRGREISETLWNKKQKGLPFFVFQKGQKCLPIIDP